MNNEELLLEYLKSCPEEKMEINGVPIEHNRIFIAAIDPHNSFIYINVEGLDCDSPHILPLNFTWRYVDNNNYYMVSFDRLRNAQSSFIDNFYMVDYFVSNGVGLDTVEKFLEYLEGNIRLRNFAEHRDKLWLQGDRLNKIIKLARNNHIKEEKNGN